MKWLTNIFSQEDGDRAWSAGEKDAGQDGYDDATEHDQPAPKPLSPESDSGVDQ